MTTMIKMNKFLKAMVIVGVFFMFVLPPGGVVTTAFAEDSLVKDACNAGAGVVIGLISCHIAKTTAWILSLATNLLTMAGTLFDYAVEYSLNMSQRLTDFNFITNGWAILRDVTNLGYIFILLYIAINIILGNSGYGDKSMIAKVLVTAVFVNFSLFGAKVIVDATNIAALQFYNLITPASTNNTNTTTSTANGRSLTGHFMKLFNLQSIYGGDTSASRSSILQSVSTAVGGSNTYTDKDEFWWKIALICTFGTIFVLAVMVVFFAGAFLFLSRTVTIFFLFLFSSLAVASRALPSTKSHFDDWLKKLIDNAIFAPIFMGLIYIFVAGTTKAGAIDFSKIFTTGGAISGLAIFCMYLAFLVGILLIAKKLGIKGGETIHGFADKYMSPKAVGRGAWSATKGTATRTVGRLATTIAESDKMKTFARYTGTSGLLSKVAEKTGVQALRDKKTKALEAKHKYQSTVSAQGIRETDADYKKRKDAAEERANASFGIDKEGKKEGGVINAVRSILGGGAYRTYRNSKAKEAKGKVKAKERGAQSKQSTWDGLHNLTGMDLIKMKGGRPDLDSEGKVQLDEKKALKLHSVLEGEKDIKIVYGGAPGRFAVRIDEFVDEAGNPYDDIKGDKLNSAINDVVQNLGGISNPPTRADLDALTGYVKNDKRFNQEIKGVLAKATSMKNILEKEDAGK